MGVPLDIFPFRLQFVVVPKLAKHRVKGFFVKHSLLGVSPLFLWAGPWPTISAGPLGGISRRKSCDLQRGLVYIFSETVASLVCARSRHGSGGFTSLAYGTRSCS